MFNWEGLERLTADLLKAVAAAKMKLLFLVAVASLAAAEPVFAPGQLAFQPSNQIYYNAVPQQPHQPQQPISYNLPFYQVKVNRSFNNDLKRTQSKSGLYLKLDNMRYIVVHQ